MLLLLWSHWPLSLSPEHNQACTVYQSSVYFSRTGKSYQTIRLWERTTTTKKELKQAGNCELRRNANTLYCFSTQLEFFLLNHLVVNTWKTWWACTRRHKVQGKAFFRVLGPCRCASISRCGDVNLKLRLWLTMMKVKQRMWHRLRQCK